MPCHKSNTWQVLPLKQPKFLDKIASLEVATRKNHKLKAAGFFPMQLAQILIQ